jgi:hypothetical protein
MYFSVDKPADEVYSVLADPLAARLYNPQV